MAKTKKTALKTYLRLIGYVKQSWGYFILGIIGTALASGIAAGFMWFLKPLLNKGFIDPNITFIKWLPLIIIAAYFILSGACFIGDYFIAWVARKVVMILQQQLFNHYLRLPFSYFNQKASGQLLAILDYNVEQVAEASSNALMTIIKDTFYIIGLTIVIFLNSWQLGLIFVLTIPALIYILKITARIMKALSLKTQDAVADLTQTAKETLEGQAVIRSFGGIPYETNKFNLATDKVRLRQVQIAITRSLGSSGGRMITSIAVAISIYLATSPIHLISAGAFISSIAAMFALFKPLRNLTEINSVLQKGIAGAESVFDILDAKVEADHGTKVLTKIHGKILYKDITFKYPGGHKDVLKNIILEIEAGQTIGIVGPTGSGKTSLINLLPRFYEPQTGVITIDGIDIQDATLSSLRSQIAIVAQHITLFHDTIAKNITYGYTEPLAPQQLEAIITAAQLKDFIQELPQGIDTIIGENGILLSGGQRQKIAIARALLRNAPILILDEATSVLDTTTEQKILQTLREFRHNKTTIIIAHRLSTTENADRILVLKDGQIIETGDHKTLMVQNGYYAQMQLV